MSLTLLSLNPSKPSRQEVPGENSSQGLEDLYCWMMASIYSEKNCFLSTRSYYDRSFM